MKKHILGLALITLSIGLLSGCGDTKSSAPQSNATATSESSTTTELEATTTEAVTTTATVTTTEAAATTTSDDNLQEPVASKDDEEKATPIKAKGTFQGFSDDNLIEVLLSDTNQYEVFFVKKASIKKQLENMEPGTKIFFEYKPLEGQANKQIISLN